MNHPGFKREIALIIACIAALLLACTAAALGLLAYPS
jgi:hypothetical protein